MHNIDVDIDSKLGLPVLVMHSGAGKYSSPYGYGETVYSERQPSMQEAAVAGWRSLTQGGSAVDAVHNAVFVMENCPIFNAGRGSYLTITGEVEMDAAIQDGRTLKAGAVSCIKHVQHPVSVARMVMEQSDHVQLTGEGAELFARTLGATPATVDELLTPKARERLQQFRVYNDSVREEFHKDDEAGVLSAEDIIKSRAKTLNAATRDAASKHTGTPTLDASSKHTEHRRNATAAYCKPTGTSTNVTDATSKHTGSSTSVLTSKTGLTRHADEHDTVGAVACDAEGNVAFATSTGGISGKLPGRVGDSPIIGSGGYADNHSGAVTTTGHGESFMKMCTAYHAAMLMEQGVAPQHALEACLKSMLERVDGRGGAIAVNTCGDVGIAFNTEGMSWCCVRPGGKVTTGIYPGECLDGDNI